MPALHSTAGRLSIALATIVIIVLLLLAACSPAAPATAPSTAPADGGNHNDGNRAAGQVAPATNDGTAAGDGTVAGDGAVAGDGPVVIYMDIVNRAASLSREDLQVQRGDLVALRFTSDEAGEVHLHGYDLTAGVAPDAPGALTFAADTAGAFGLNFHIFAAGDTADGDGGDDHDHGGSSHAPLELAAPVSVSVAATPDDAGGVNVRIATEGWRWAPENVNEAHRPGEGHAHIYVDGVKINRIYGPDYYLPGLAAGARRIRVTLNANSHEELLSDGQPVAAAITVTVPDADHSHGDSAAHDLPPVETGVAAMSVTAQAHPDPLGGYNLRVDAAGFDFAPENAGGAHQDGQGYGVVAIDGVPQARLYGGWHQLPALPPGTHTVEVSLRANDGAPYQRDGRLVAASVTLEVADESEDGGGGEGNSHSHADNGHSHSHDADAGGREVVAEVHLGNLEVYP